MKVGLLSEKIKIKHQRYDNLRKVLSYKEIKTCWTKKASVHCQLSDMAYKVSSCLATVICETDCTFKKKFNNTAYIFRIWPADPFGDLRTSPIITNVLVDWGSKLIVSTLHGAVCMVNVLSSKTSESVKKSTHTAEKAESQSAAVCTTSRSLLFLPSRFFRPPSRSPASWNQRITGFSISSSVHLAVKLWWSAVTEPKINY